MAQPKLSVVEIEILLKDWPKLSNYLKTSDEVNSKILLEAEKKGRKRESILNRIYARYSRQRRRREREELKG